jgi:hypothetical protein
VRKKFVSMAKKKRVSLGERLGQMVRDIANAASVAATGSEIGVLELAAEDELDASAAKPSRKAKATPKKKVASKKSSSPKKKKRAGRRR